MTETQRKVLLIIGEPASGKSTSLINLRNQDTTVYFNCEGGGKMLPFKSNMFFNTITDPDELIHKIQLCSTPDFIHPATNKPVTRIVVDGFNFLMDMVEAKYVIHSTEQDHFKRWVNYAMFFQNLMINVVGNSPLEFIFIAHTAYTFNQFGEIVKSSVPIKGSTKDKGVESYFTLILQAKSVKIIELEKFENSLLHITEDEEFIKSKYVFKTIKTEDYEKIRSFKGLFSIREMYIDNDVQAVLDRIDEFNKQQ